MLITSRTSISSLHSRRLVKYVKHVRSQTTLNTNEVQTLSWPEYLAIRRAKRRWEMAATIPATVITFGIGANYFASMEIDHTKTFFGVDPIFVLGAATIACGGLGYLLGPTIGGAIWKVSHRQILPLVEARERDFYQHIVRNRVDPRYQSTSNPVPDYHGITPTFRADSKAFTDDLLIWETGEKIGSLNQYRQWLRDQAKFRKKAAWESDP